MTCIQRISIAMLLGVCLPASALVDPIAADIEEQGWMANVLIKGSRDQFYTLFCEGSLIDRYWVMSSASCLDDPYEILEKKVGSDKPEFAVALGNLGGLYKVEERIISPDRNVMLLRLNRPATNQPIRVLYRSAAELKGVQVRIFNAEYSTALAHEIYNPIGNVFVSCKIQGAEFYSNNRMCYVIAKPKSHFKPRMAMGQLVDTLSADAPNRALNSMATSDNAGDRLHINFFENKGYPCHEDVGAPIIATLNGELVQVGMVVTAGMATGIPVCNDSFVNHLSSLSAQASFIKNSIDRGRFKQQCPATANLAYEQLSGNRVRFFWDAVDQAQGYRTLYSSNLGYVPIESIDVGNITEAIVHLEAGVTHALAIQAYNANCTGNMSRPLEVSIK